MNFIRCHLPVIILQLCTYTVLTIALGGFLFNPNGRLFNPGGDGIKNYYTFAYHLKYGSGWWFEGMTYPYGEHFLFTDSFAGYARLLNFIDNQIITLYPYSVGIINLTVLLSFGFCTYFLYKILKYYNVADWWAIPTALCICFLSPQVRRIEFHYSLAFLLYVPMLWFFILRMLHVSPSSAQKQRTTLLWALGIVAGIVFFGLIHPYYLPLGSFFVLAFAGIYTLQNIFNLRIHLTSIFTLFATALLPILILGIFTALTDPVTDRHLAPYGLWVYVSRFEGVFFPSFGQIRSWWTFLKLPGMDMEGIAYVGFWGLPILIFTAGQMLYVAIKKRNFVKAFNLTEHATLNTALWASTLLLILSFALPFIWFGFLLDWMPQLRQFRSLGRFAWAFYYVYAVYMAYLFYYFLKILLIKKKKVWAVIVGIIVIGFWAYEAGLNIDHTAKVIYKHKGENTVFKDNNDYGKYLAEAGRTSDDFQAILPFPYFNNGSEKWYIYRFGRAAREAYQCSYETGLPIATFHSPRTSISQAGKLAQLLSSDLIEKRILKDLNKKPLLLIVLNNSKLEADEKRVIQKGKEIFKNKKITLYELPLKVFETNFEKIQEKYRQEKFDKNRSLKLPEHVIWKHYNDMPSEHKFRGGGAMNSGDSPLITLYDGKMKADRFPKQFEASVWVYADSSKCSFPKLFYWEFNPKGERVGLKVVNPKHETEVYGEGHWVLAKATFNCLSANNRVHIYLESEDQKTTGIIADEWLLRPADTEVFYDDDGWSFMYNNYRIMNE